MRQLARIPRFIQAAMAVSCIPVFLWLLSPLLWSQFNDDRRRTDLGPLTLPGGSMMVEWRDDNHVWMTGPVETEFEGTIDPETLAWQVTAKGAA